MVKRTLTGVVAVLLAATASWAQSGPTVPPPNPMPDVTALVSRLDLERYKATIKGLTQFGDRRQGTERNRKAVDWIEAQLRSYGCAPERMQYDYNPPPASPAAGSGQQPHCKPCRGWHHEHHYPWGFTQIQSFGKCRIWRFPIPEIFRYHQYRQASR